MPDISKRAVVAAVDDDRFLLARAEFVLQDRDYELVDLSDIEAVPRDIRKTGGNLNTLELVPEIVRFTPKTQGSTDVFAVSMFGTVGLNDGIVRHVSGSKKGELEKSSLDLPFLLRTQTPNPQAIVYVDNDASAAALGESIAGAGQGIDSFAYVWLGRGINVGLILGRDIWRGRLHPEAGHGLVRLLSEDQLERGTCAIHRDCVLGRASFRSIEERLNAGASAEQVRFIVGSYIAQLCMSTMLFAAPQAIAIGGYILRENMLDGLIAEVNARFAEYVGVYPSYSDNIDPTRFIVPARLGPEGSILGMLEVTRRNLNSRLVQGAGAAR